MIVVSGEGGMILLIIDSKHTTARNNSRRSSDDVVEAFHTVRINYLAELIELRRKYANLFASIVIDNCNPKRK